MPKIYQNDWKLSDNFLITSKVILQFEQDINIKSFTQDEIVGENVSFGANMKYVI